MDARGRAKWLAVTAAGALALVSLEACKGDGATTSTEDKPAPAAATPTKTAEGMAGPINTGFGVPLSANKCPSAAAGATTTVKEIADGVEVTVTAPGGSPINDIRQRGVQIIAAAKDPATGGGSEADGLAKCPIVVKDTVITETDVPGGATFTVKPAKAAALADLKKETKARATVK